MKLKALLSFMLSMTMLAGTVPVVAAQIKAPDLDLVYPGEDDGTVPQKPTWYIWQDTTSTSSFDVNKTATAKSSTVATKEVMYVGIYNDKSTILPASANREITPVTGGKLTLEFDFALDRGMDGTAFRLLDKSKTAFGIITKNSSIYLEQPNNEFIYLGSFATSRIIDSYTTDVKTVIDIDKNIIEKVYINGKLCASNKPFVQKINRITSFDMTTSREAVGNVMMRYLKLYGGYDVYEMFHSGNGLPEDWKKSGSGTAGIRAFNYRYADRNSLELDSSHGKIEYKRDTASHNGKVTFETQLLLPTKRNGVKIALFNGQEEVFAFSADTNKFSYASGSNDNSFYEYLGNVWYHFRADVDLKAHKADIYLNGKLKCEGVSISNASEINGIGYFVEKGNGTVVVDDIILYDTPEIPDDYVTEPNKVSSDEYAIAMQMCPLWTEGTHNGWDEMNAARGRVPLLGYYDEGDPEYADWAIKYMAEHGIDFWLPCMYTCYALEEAERDPIKDNSFRHGYAIHNGYFNALYSNDMPFAILWENGGYSGARATEKDFFENLVPFWIEYYFKDSRYYRIDGRPVMSIFNPTNFFSLFEGDTKNDAVVIERINKFKQMCIDAGVGDPILMTNVASVSFTQEEIDRWERLGLEGFSKYNYSIFGNMEMHKSYLNDYKELTSSTPKLEVFPALCTGFNGVPWDSSNMGYESTPAEYKEFLKWLKDEYLPSLPKSRFSKRILVAATWDEFGEGTILCPNEKYGFGHLDAIRDVFIGESEHEDIVPTDKQKARISNLYNPDRNANYTKEIMLPDISGQEVIHSWNFESDLGDWIVGGDISGVEHRDGAAVIKLSGLTPSLVFTKPLDLYNLNYMKVTMKSGVSKGGTIKWTTNLSQNADNKKYRVMQGNGIPNGEYTDYYIPVGENSRYWKGTLSQLTFVLGQFYDTNEEVYLKSIEFLGTPQENCGLKLKMGDYHTAVDTITDTDGNVLVYVKPVIEEMGGMYGEMVKEESAILKLGEDSIIIKNGEKIAEKNGEKVELLAAPVVYNDAFYVPISILGEVTFGSFNYEAKTKTLECTSLDGEETGERAVIYEYKFETADDIAGMSFNGGFTNRVFTDGGYKMTVSSDDPYFYIKPENIKAEDVKRIEIGMKSSAVSTGKVYFATSNATNLNEAKTVGFALSASDETKSYILNCEQNSQWTGDVLQLRMDLVDKGCIGKWINVEYVRFLGDVIQTEEGSAQESCVSISDTSYVWNFSKNTEFDGFKPSKHIADLEAINGELCFRAANVTPMIETGSGVTIEADKYKKATFQLKNNTAGNYMRMYFTSNNGGAIEKENCYEVKITPNDSVGTMYTINLADNENWKGEIKGLLLEFSKEQGVVKIDNIRFEVVD